MCQTIAKTGFSLIPRHCEQNEAISGLPRRSLKLSPRNDGFRQVERFICHSVARLSHSLSSQLGLHFMCHSVARLFAKAKSVSAESVRSCADAHASHRMTGFSLHLSSRFAARHRDPDTGAAALAGMTAAFSLIELSIVLVILGLLTGGILTGQNLIRAAELRSVTTQLSSYQTAINTFRDKYLALPGDMPNAVRFWGAQAGGTADGIDVTCAALDAVAATGKETCNGNGNGTIADFTIATEHHEMFRAWQHLANAGLIEGAYSGVNGSVGNSTHAVIGENIPRSKIANGGFTLGFVPGVSDANNFTLTATHQFWFGAQSATSVTVNPILSAEETWGIDTKIDDGRPAFGKVRTPNATYSANCVTTDVDATAEYNLTTSGAACALYYHILR